MKKKLLMIGLLALALGTSSAYAQKNTTEKENALCSLGIVSSELGGQKVVTNEDFLSAVVNMMTNDGVPKNNSYAYAKKIGIASGISEFKLNNALTKDYAFKIALRALGYDKVMKQGGETEELLLTLASDAGLTKGVNMSELNGENVIKLLYNLSEAGMMELNLNGNDYKFNGNEETLLEHYRDIEVIEGTVTATGRTSLIKSEGLPENQIEIDNVSYTIKGNYAPELLGAYVEAYVTDNGEEIIYVAAVEDKREVLEVKADEITEVNKHFEYINYAKEDEEKERKVKLSSTLKVVFNGKLYSDYTVEDLNPAKGKLIFADNDNDGKYDIVFVYSYKTMIAESVSALENTITNKFNYEGAMPTLKFDENDTLEVYAADGTAMSLSGIKSGNVLNIAQSLGDEDRIITIFVSSEKVTGEATALDNNEEELTIGGKTYDISYVYYEALKNGDTNMTEIKIGNPTVLYLDNDGEVAFAQNDRLGGFEYIFALKAKELDVEGYAVRAMNMNGDWKTYEFADKVKVNNKDKKMNSEEVYNYLVAELTSPQLIMVKVNNQSGKITSIKLPEETDECKMSAFTKTPQRQRIYWNFNYSFDCADYITTDTPIILTPSDSEQIYDEKAYQIGKAELLNHWHYCTYSAYNKDENNMADIVVAKEQSGTTGSTFMLNSIEYGLNSDGEPVKALKGEMSRMGGLTIYEYEPDLIQEYKSGDILEITLRDGKIKDAKKKYSLDDGIVYKTMSGSWDSNQSIWGTVKAVDTEKGLVTITCSADGKTVYTLKKHASECGYVMWNKETKKYEQATMNEIEKGDFVIASTFSCTMRTCIIIKR